MWTRSERLIYRNINKREENLDIKPQETSLSNHRYPMNPSWFCHASIHVMARLELSLPCYLYQILYLLMIDGKYVVNVKEFIRNRLQSTSEKQANTYFFAEVNYTPTSARAFARPLKALIFSGI